MPNIKLYRQYVDMAQNVCASRFESVVLHYVPTLQIR